MTTSDSNPFEDRRFDDDFSEENITVADQVPFVVIRHAGQTYDVAFESGKTARHYLKESGADLKIGLLGIAAGRTLSDGDGNRINLRSVIAAPCTITVNTKVSNG